MTSEIFVVERPQFPPAKCVRCGSEKYDGRKYADVATVEEYGAVYLCTFCIRETFKAAFEDAGAPVSELEAKLADAYQTIELQKDLLKLREDQIKQLETTYGVSRNSAGNLIVGTDRSDPVASVENSVDDDSDSDDSGSGEADTGTSEQNTSSRRKNVPSLTELLDPVSSSD